VHAIAVAPGGDSSLTSGALMRDDADDGVQEGAAVEMGLNSYLERRWLPPDPPPGHGPHRYAFQCFALGQKPSFSRAPGRHELLEAILGQSIAAGCLVGTYERVRRQPIAETEEEAATAESAAPATA
jgi:hypothetical protein